MKALHVNWTKPSGNEYFAEDFELLTTILSALKWREKNGNIKMITDKVGFEFYKSKNMLDIWDEVDVSLDDMPLNINPQMFWAAGKLYAAKTNKEPFAMLDTDFIVWDRLAFESFGDLAVIHDEEINNDVYPDIHHFDMKYGSKNNGASLLGSISTKSNSYCVLFKLYISLIFICSPLY